MALEVELHSTRLVTDGQLRTVYCIYIWHSYLIYMLTPFHCQK